MWRFPKIGVPPILGTPRVYDITTRWDDAFPSWQTLW